jgi:hypothetical protein
VRCAVFRRALLALVLLVAAALLGAGPSLSRAATAPAAFSVAGVDLHDGMVADFGGTYYLYGTEYGCGFQWNVANTPWCGFGVSTAASLAGPWSAPLLLFPATSTDPWTGQTWQVECGSTGSGCFNPRMIQRTGWGSSDGTFILWFNSPADYLRSHANAYNAMGCLGAAGPCGAGVTGGSYHKPGLSFCDGDGDFGVAYDNPQPPVLVCTGAGQALATEQMDQWGTNGTSVGSANLAGLATVEGPGVYQDPATGTWVLTYSDPNCGYCAGTGTGYATASSPFGTWTAPANRTVSVLPPGGRRDISATSCGGQPRTVSVVDGQPWQGVDLWTGARNEATAGLEFVPLTLGPASGTAGDGAPWHAPLTLACA